MWLFVLFDLPTETKKNRKDATRFRNRLLDDGFNMIQYSVYSRHCPTSENADVHQRRVCSFIPPKGQVSILRITDKQYENIVNFWSQETEPLPASPQQLELF